MLLRGQQSSLFYFAVAEMTPSECGDPSAFSLISRSALEGK